MLLAYALRTPQSPHPELCIIPERPDQFSCLVPVAYLHETTAAIFRLGVGEAFRVLADNEKGGMIIDPIAPSKIFLTPSQADRPGIQVKSVKIMQEADGRLVSYYLQERGGSKDVVWQRFSSNDVAM